MRRLIVILVALAVTLVLFVWRDAIWMRAATWQRSLQETLAGTLIAIRAGQPGAWVGLMVLCFGYGFAHAVGPGHGKLLVGGWGLARPIGMRRLAGVAALASLGQAVTAILLVSIGVAVLGLTRAGLDGLAAGGMTQVSRALLAGIGLWLIWRGGRRSWRAIAARAGHHHDHQHRDAAACPDCGHRHAPAPDEIAAAGSWRALAALIAAIAIRPCSGALILLVLCWQMGIFAAGIAGAFAMALGTAALTVTVAMASVSLRMGALAGALERPAWRHVAGLVELGLGLAVIAAAWVLRGAA